MQRFFRYSLLVLLSFFTFSVMAQTNVWRDIYKVKKKDTIYGIARSYGLTVDELVNANPEMKNDDYRLKKGMSVFIPYSKPKEPEKPAKPKMHTEPGQTLRVGMMLPLHDKDGDGQRMVEYYRGFLIGCDSLRKAGVNVDIHAWNVDIDSDINETLKNVEVKNLDIIFGPIYTDQVQPLADFCRQNEIKLVIPMSIKANDVQTNPQVYQVYENGLQITEKSISVFLERFKGCHAVFIDCNDKTSDKGQFTFGLRKRMEEMGMKYSITNLNSSEEQFSKMFYSNQRNVVILNTGRSPELNLAMRKLNELRVNRPKVEISMFGYNEWLSYESVFRELFHRYDAYVPSTYYYNKGLSRIINFEQNYNKWFGVRTQERYIPRFAETGYDHAQFFLRGLYEKGSDFQGTAAESFYKPMQTPLRFERIQGGGMQNTAFQLVHYKNNRVIVVE